MNEILFDILIWSLSVLAVLGAICWVFTLILAVMTGEYQRQKERYDYLKSHKKPGLFKRIIIWFGEDNCRRWGM